MAAGRIWASPPSPTIATASVMERTANKRAPTRAPCLTTPPCFKSESCPSGSALSADCASCKSFKAFSTSLVSLSTLPIMRDTDASASSNRISSPLDTLALASAASLDNFSWSFRIPSIPALSLSDASSKYDSISFIISASRKMSDSGVPGDLSLTSLIASSNAVFMNTSMSCSVGFGAEEELSIRMDGVDCSSSVFVVAAASDPIPSASSRAIFLGVPPMSPMMLSYVASSPPSFSNSEIICLYSFISSSGVTSSSRESLAFVDRISLAASFAVGSPF
mmetsp:Transcript_20413/g.36971  ORF Transcript_20413/g.36971 Transcript_20413/m.36971 type:complete len:279 (-) Transcript_20413:415-1251(-)